MSGREGGEGIDRRPKTHGLSLKERIEYLSMPEPNSGCWIWMGSLDHNGYGKAGAYINGVREKESLAHRFSYREFVGAIPHGMHVDHICRNRACVNPQHLQVLSHLENIRRADCSSGHRNTKKTHCPKGHEYSEDNTIIEKGKNRPWRKCRICTNAAHMARYHRKQRKIKTHEDE